MTEELGDAAFEEEHQMNYGFHDYDKYDDSSYNMDILIYDKEEYVIIDTAGIRKSGKIYENIEKYSVLRAMKAIERSDVCVLVINAEEGIFLYGDDDPFADYKIIEEIAEEKELNTFRVSGGNHSLETGDIDTDLENIRNIIQCVAIHGRL